MTQTTRVGLLGISRLNKSSGEIKNTWDYLSTQPDIKSGFLTLKKLGQVRKLAKYDVIWIHLTDSTILPGDVFLKSYLDNLKQYVENGGGLFLTGEAFPLINLLEVESLEPELVRKEAKDSGYGRMLGFHGFRSHPVFAGLNGGAYILKPSDDIVVRNWGYFGNNIPANGKVVATDWDYIFLREDKKIILEYDIGKGKIIAVGSYINFNYPGRENAKNGEIYNVNRQHLEKFTHNCISYLANQQSDTRPYYWSYREPWIGKFKSSNIAYFPLRRPTKKSFQWDINDSVLKLSNRFATNYYWDVAGERMLIMGKEAGGIDEIWAHPFMAFRDYEVGIRFSYKDTIYWLNDETPMVDVTPEAFTRLYQFKRAFLKEIITVSPDQPQGVIHYEYRGVYPADVFVRFKTNQRLMWPYSENVLGGFKYDFHDALNAFIIADLSGDFVSMLGYNKPTEKVIFASSPMLPSFRNVKNPIGNYTNISGSDSLWRAEPADLNELILTGLSQISLEMNDNFDVIIIATDQGIQKAIGAFQEAQVDPSYIYRNASEYRAKNAKKFLQFTTPDNTFNEGYQWALEGTDRFFVHTPGIGSSLVAGYGTTATGWDGEHTVNGRPGYAWYFGRDSEWSAMALLHYGDFEKVKGVLEMLQKYQDLNGKIFHELSTSGLVHYDAADATPLYVVVAGRYLKHSGDMEFIRESWPHIIAAMDFMYSTDTDNDGLIENTNVGHGWVEGGSLFGSHTSLYLASCWAEALQEASYIAGNLGYADLAKKYIYDSDVVTQKINTLYLNETGNYYYQGLKQDGSFIEDNTIMQTIPALFGQLNENPTKSVLEEFAKNEYTADWGVRIISENSPSFNPRGYHTGSVWPLYTGWTSLAEYQFGRPVQGFTHLMNNLQIYKNWALGFTEEVLNGEKYEPSGVCRHQCWSETMVLQPAIEGMLGLRPNAVNNELELSPDFPANWGTVLVENIRIGKHMLDFNQFRSGNRVGYQFHKTDNDALQVKFNPAFPAGTEIVSVLLDGFGLEYQDVSGIIEFDLMDQAYIEFQFENGIEVIPIIPRPKPGYTSEGFRVVSNQLKGKVFEVGLQARTGARETFEVYIHGQNPVKVEKAEIIDKSGDLYTFSVDFPEVDSKYANQTVKIFLD
nr:hypothetical protein [Bacteroidota bacterium]